MFSLTESELYEELCFEESLKMNDFKHSSHILLYCIDNDFYYALTQMRFDGRIGFPGGEVDVEQVSVEDVIEASNRELYEEINYSFESVVKTDWVCTHRRRIPSERFIQHFFAKQLSVDEFTQIEKIHMNAEHFPSESLGLFRVPIGETEKQKSFTSKYFLSNFLRQLYAGNAKQQLFLTIKKLSLLSTNVGTDGQTLEIPNDKRESNQLRVKTLIYSEVDVHYHESVVSAVYGLMHITNDGLFDFFGSTLLADNTEDSIIETISQSINKELSSVSLEINSNNTKLLLRDDKESILYYGIKISSNQLIAIEKNYTQFEIFMKNSFGLFRIPLVFNDNNYLNRFIKGFTQQTFVDNNTSDNLNQIWNKFNNKLF